MFVTGNVEEAVKYHKEAADILNELMQNILDEKVAESLRLQAQLHEKESKRALLLRSQRKQVYRNLESLRKMANGQNGAGENDSLQLSIYRKFEETESLLDQLKITDDSSSVIASSSERSFIAESQCHENELRRNIVVGEASKKPKDEKVIIEELQVANSHLRKMVEELFSELSGCQRENLELRNRVRYLEGMHGSTIPIRPQPFQSHSAQPSPKHPGMRTFRPEVSPMVPRPTVAVAQQAAISDDSISLPHIHLAPLEMPTFDFEA